MKKIALISLVLALAACSPDEQTTQRNQANEKLQQAEQHIRNATAGYVAQSDANISLSQYQQQERDKASSILRTVVNSGDPVQRATASIELAALNAADAQALAQQAVQQASQVNDPLNKLIPDITSAVASQAIVANAAQLSNASELSSIKTQAEQGAATQSQIQAQIAQLNNQLAQFKSRHNDLQQQRRQMVSQTADMNDQLLGLHGQEHYDLYQKISDLKLKAAQLDNQAETLSTQISLIESQISVAQTSLDQVARKTKATEVRYDLSTQLLDRNAKSIADAKEKVAAFLTELNQTVNTQADAFNASVIKPLDEAVDMYNKAIQGMQSAKGRIGRTSSQATEMGAMNLQASFSELLQQYHAILETHVTTLQMLRDQLAASFSAEALTALDARIDQAKKKLDEVKTTATQALTAAREAITNYADQASDAKVKMPLVRSLISINRGLAMLTGDEQYTQQAEAYEQQLAPANPATPAPATPEASPATPEASPANPG